MSNMINILILDWKSSCEQFIQETQYQHEVFRTQHESCEENNLCKICFDILSTKYLNLSLIEKFVEILPKFNNENETHICSAISQNPALTMEIILAYPSLMDFDVGLIFETNMNLIININDILAHPELKWNWIRVSKNPSVTLDIVLSNIDKPWNWKYLSRHRNITMADIQSHLDLPWNWYSVSNNPNLTMEMIESHPDKEWNWFFINMCITLTTSE